MEEKEIWKLVQNWISIEKHKEDKNFLEHIDSLNYQNERLKPYNLELYYGKRDTRKKSIYFIITPYLIQVYQGTITEVNGRLKIESWEMLEQISCDSIKMPEIIGRGEVPTEPFDLIAPFVKEEAYILNGLSSGSLNYYQEKDENGLYGRTLETEHFIKIGPRKEHNQLDVQIERACVSDFQNIEELELLQDGETILPILKNQSQGSYLIAIEAINKLLENKVGKVYQLL